MNLDKTNKDQHFGEHLTIDGYGGNFKILNDKESVFSFVDTLPAKLGMNKLCDTTIKWADSNDKKDPGGWSVFVMIAESHIALHTFPEKGFLSADVYTCQNGLDVERITGLFKDFFNLAEIETNFIVRGKKYLAQ